ncbi:MAG: TolC family protein [Elusimicrobia bacterium]|nr:TolC family protein [Elusimicrobiota bacterium]
MKKVIHTLLTALILIGFSVILVAKDIPLVSLKLSDIEQKTAENSPRLKASQKETEAFIKRSESAKAQLFPKLNFEGSYRYISVIPEIDIPIKGFGSLKLGDNTNYSIGPALYWTVWDKNAIRNNWLSFKSQATSKKYETETIERQIMLAARVAYFQAGLANEQVLLLSDALKVLQAQYEDIVINVKAGAKSRMDELSAHQEVIIKMKQLRTARSYLAQCLDDLSALTNEKYGDNPMVPFSAGIIENLPKNITSPTLFLEIEPVDALIKKFEKYKKSKLSENHPNVISMEELAESAKLLSKSISSGLWPKLQFSARTSLDYPNGPKLEAINQNALGVNLTWILFEGSASRKKSQENILLGEAQTEKRNQVLRDLQKEWQKLIDQLADLEEQKVLNEQYVSEAKELSKIVYSSYKAGSANFIDVQNANYRLLEAKTQSVKTKFQILVNLVTMASLAE